MTSNTHPMTITMTALIGLTLGLAGAGQAMAQFSFGEPENLGSVVNTSAWDFQPSISADGLTLFFESDRPGGFGGNDLWMTTRASLSSPWEPPVNLGPTVNSSASDAHPSISADGLTLFFASNRPGGFGSRDLWMTTRASHSSPWEPPLNLGSVVNSSADEAGPSISADGLTLFFASTRPGGFGVADLWMTTRASHSSPWEPPENLGSVVNSSQWEGNPSISADGLTLFFSTLGDIYMTTRASVSDPWETRAHLGPTVNTSSNDGSPDISADGLTLFFSSDRPGGEGDYDLWQVAVTPTCPADINGDGLVDVLDLLELLAAWGPCP